MLVSVTKARIVLVRTKESANIGAAARAMLNFGLTDLWLVAPRCKVNHRSYALASHAAELLDKATIVEHLEDAIADRELVFGTSARVRAAENYVVHSPKTAARVLSDTSAVLFGPEDHGLSNEDLTRCQAQVVIPTHEFSSLNLAQAVLVIAYELGLRDETKEASAVAPPPLLADLPEDHVPAERSQVEGFYGQLAQTLLHIGYTDVGRLPGILRLYRGLIDRARPSTHDLAALRGLLRQAKWAADQQPENVPGNRTGQLDEDTTD